MNKQFKFETNQNYTFEAIEKNKFTQRDDVFKFSTNGTITPKRLLEYLALYSKIVPENIDSNTSEKYYKNEIQKSLISIDSSVSKTNNNYFLRQKEYRDKEAERFLSMLRNDFIESGYYSNSEVYLKSKLKEDPIVAKSWLNSFFYDNLDNPEMLVKLLHIISDIDYNLMKPEGPILAMAAASHKNVEVQEYAIGVFEKWVNPESLKALKNISFKTKWLQDYANEVIEDLEEELF